jgi:ABC-type dipeptide/oligopeptide/nickel transport system permease subunit
MMHRGMILILGALYVLVTTVQHRVIMESFSSVISFLLLVFTEPKASFSLWRNGLFEYWLAAVVWLGSGLWIALSAYWSFFTRDRSTQSTPAAVLAELGATQKRSLRFLLLCVYIALVCPFLVAIGPNIQGNLVTTRLLPPFSTGYVRQTVEEAPARSDGERRQSVREYVRSSTYLLDRSVDVSGAEEEHSSWCMFLLGTDDAGRDVFSRALYGTRVSLGIGILAALGAILIGSCIGFVSGLSGGAIDALLMRLTDLFLAVPGLFLVVALVAFLGQSVITVIVILSLTGWMGVARIVRGEVISLREKEFILTAKMLRVPAYSIIIRHILPNVRPVIVTSAVLQFAGAVLAEAALGFLGFGVQPPTASWGNMLGESIGYLHIAWWLGVFPGALLATVIVCAHLMGEVVD